MFLHDFRFIGGAMNPSDHVGLGGQTEQTDQSIKFVEIWGNIRVIRSVGSPYC